MTDKNEFAGMPEIPAHVYEQIDKGFHKYLFFETVKRGHRRYTCTACHQTFDEGELVLKDLMSAEDFALFHAKHNDEAECPLCGARATVKNVKVCDVSRLWESRCTAVFMANGYDDVWVRCIYADRGYRYRPKEGTRYLAGHTLTFESNRYHLQPGVAVGWKRFAKDSPLYRTAIFEEPFSWNHSMFMEKYGYSTVWVNEEGIEGTFLRYNGIQKSDGRFSHGYPIRYLCHYARHPQLEMLMKLGHRSTVNSVVLQNCENTRILDWNAKKPWEMFRLTRKEYNRWGQAASWCRFDIDVLKIYKRMHGKGERDFEYAEELEKVFCTKTNAYKFLAKVKRLGLSLPEVIKYIRRVQASSMGGCHHCPGITLGGAYTLWEDYIDLADGLGRLATVSLMPKDLKSEHDVLLGIMNGKREREARLAAKKHAADAKKERERIEREKERGIRTDAKREAAKLGKTHPGIAKFYEKIVAKYAWGNDTYTVVVPRDCYDILYDGMKLGHCVGNVYKSGWLRYLDRTRAGESFLLLLRRTKAPDVPYCTLEVEPGGVVRQKRFAGDAEVDDSVKAFLALWQAAIAPRMTKKDKQAAERSREIRLAEYAELRQNKTIVHNGHLRGKLLADVLEADLLEVGFATDETKNIKPREGRKKAV